jgi:hypothetical protein
MIIPVAASQCPFSRDKYRDKFDWLNKEKGNSKEQQREIWS